MTLAGGLELTLDHVLRRATTLFFDKEIVSVAEGGVRARHSYAAFGDRVLRLAEALRAMGIGAGDSVGSLCWNHHEHLEAYFAVPLLGAKLHTLNARQSPEQIAYAVRHAGDRLLIVDAGLLHLIGEAAAGLPKLVVGTDYEAALSRVGSLTPLSPLPRLDERTEMMVCHTSGTTGPPKGAVYTHRSTVLLALALCTADGLAISEADTVMPVVPMYHGAAWVLPYAACMVGSKLVLPAPLRAEALLDAIVAEEVTVAAAVPTVWTEVLEAMDRAPDRWRTRAWKRVMIGGAAVPRTMITRFDRHGIEVMHCWGMTETNPVGFRCRPSKRHREPEQRFDVLTSQGYPLPLVEARHVAPDGAVLPRDGVAQGELEVRGPWVIRQYLGGEGQEQFRDDGWFRTGDVVTIDEHGYARIRDRLKDVIKSGGEWISSVVVETSLMNHPAVQEAAVFATPHPKWGERPIAAVVVREGMSAEPAELGDYLEAHMPKFWVPDDFVFVGAIPRTSTGKFQKTALRERYRTHLTRG